MKGKERTMYKYVTAFATIMLGCAPAVAPQEPQVSRVAQEVAQDPPPASGTIDREQTAGSYLEQAMMMFSLKQWHEAIEFYTSAVNTGNLNDAGRSLVYWHIAQSWIGLGNEDEAMEALSSFIMVSQDVMDMREIRQYAVTDNGDFVDQFDLKNKLAWARATVNFVWSTKSNVYGRSTDNPILARNIEELEEFVKMVKSMCIIGECDFQRAVLNEDGVQVVPRTERVTLKSKGSEQSFVIVIP